MIELFNYIKLDKSERQKHINLQELCIERGGNSTIHKGVLAQYLNTNISEKNVLLAHACNNGNCSNPKHLYWATHYENIVEDGTKFKTWSSIWDKTVKKYGIEKAKQMNKNNANPSLGGKGNKGKTKSEEHKRKISESLRNKKARVTELV